MPTPSRLIMLKLFILSVYLTFATDLVGRADAQELLPARDCESGRGPQALWINDLAQFPLCYQKQQWVEIPGVASNTTNLSYFANGTVLIGERFRPGPNVLLLYYRLLMDRPFHIWAKVPAEWAVAHELQEVPTPPHKIDELQTSLMRSQDAGVSYEDAMVALFSCLAGDQASGCSATPAVRHRTIMNLGFGPVLEHWRRRELALSTVGWAPLADSAEPVTLDTFELSGSSSPYTFADDSNSFCVYWLERQWLDLGYTLGALEELRSDPDYVAAAFDTQRALSGLGVFSPTSELKQALSSTLLGIPVAFARRGVDCAISELPSLDRELMLIYALG